MSEVTQDEPEFDDSADVSESAESSGEADEVAGVADYIRRQAPAITSRESRSSDREWSPIKAGGLGFLFPPLGYVYTREYWIAFESLLQVGMYYVKILLTFIGAVIGAAILRGVLLLLSEELLGSRVLRQGAEILPPILLLLTALALVGLWLYAHGTLAREIYHDTIALNDGRREHKVSDDAMGGYKENE